MSTIEPGGPLARTMRMGDDDRGYAWVVFAGVMLTLAGTVNVIDGLGAIGGSRFFTRHGHYIVANLTALGWVVLIIGVVQVLAGFGVLAKNQFARWVGVTAAALNGVAQLLLIQSYPFLSLAVFALDILVMHGLLVHGGGTERPS